MNLYTVFRSIILNALQNPRLLLPASIHNLQFTTYNSKGFALIPILIIVALAAAVPATVLLVQEEQDNRQEAQNAKSPPTALNFDDEYYVQPIVFFPSDYPVEQAVVNHVNQKVKEIQKWYSDKNYGSTFNYRPAITATGDQNAEWYWCNGHDSSDKCNKYEQNIDAELEKQGIDINNPNQLKTTYLVIFMGGGGVAHGYMGPHTVPGRNAFVGDITIYPELDGNCNRVKQFYFESDGTDSVARCINENLASTQNGTGSIAHELGHTFGLPHPDNPGGRYSPYPPGSPEARNTIMQNQGIYPDGDLLPEEEEILSNNHVFNNRTHGLDGRVTVNTASNLTDSTEIIVVARPSTGTDISANSNQTSSTDTRAEYEFENIRLPEGSYTIFALAKKNDAELDRSESIKVTIPGTKEVNLTLEFEAEDDPEGGEESEDDGTGDSTEDPNSCETIGNQELSNGEYRFTCSTGTTCPSDRTPYTGVYSSCENGGVCCQALSAPGEKEEEDTPSSDLQLTAELDSTDPVATYSQGDEIAVNYALTNSGPDDLAPPTSVKILYFLNVENSYSNMKDKLEDVMQDTACATDPSPCANVINIVPINGTLAVADTIAGASSNVSAPKTSGYKRLGIIAYANTEDLTTMSDNGTILFYSVEEGSGNDDEGEDSSSPDQSPSDSVPANACAPLLTPVPGPSTNICCTKTSNEESQCFSRGIDPAVCIGDPNNMPNGCNCAAYQNGSVNVTSTNHNSCASGFCRPDGICAPATGGQDDEEENTPDPDPANCDNATGKGVGCSCTQLASGSGQCATGNCAINQCAGGGNVCCPANQVYCGATRGCTAASQCKCLPGNEDIPDPTSSPGGTCTATQNQTQGNCASGYVCINTKTGPQCLPGGGAACLQLNAACSSSNNNCCSGMSCQGGTCQKITSSGNSGGSGGSIPNSPVPSPASACTQCVTSADCNKSNICGQDDGNTCIMNNGYKFCVKY